MNKIIAITAILTCSLSMGQSQTLTAVSSAPRAPRTPLRAALTPSQLRIVKTDKLHPTLRTQLLQMQVELDTQHNEMQEQILVLQQQLEQMKIQNAQTRKASVPAPVVVDAAEPTRQLALAANTKAVTSLEGQVSSLQGAENVLAATVKSNQTTSKTASDNPVSIRYKGVNLTPRRFLAAEMVWRQHQLQADIASPFNSIPIPGTALSNISEFRMSAHQSRMNVLAESKVGKANIFGFLEFDMLGAGLTSNSNESNSYIPRMRHAWLRADWNNGWSMAAGQMWTLATSNRKGITSFVANAYLPDMIDGQYVVGFNWLRQPSIRVVRQLGSKVWLAASVEGAQTTFSALNAPANFLYASAGTTNLTSTVMYSFDKAPDILAKVAFEPGFGHYEIKGVARFFRDRVYPGTPASTTGAYNYDRLGGGIGAAASWNLAKKLDFSLNGLMGNGVGRYGTSQLADTTVAPDGTLRPIHGGHGVGTLEFNPNKKWKIYAYSGAEYAGRKAFVDPITGKGVGYGSRLDDNSGCITEAVPTSPTTPTPTSSAKCHADTRSIFQEVVGFWYRPYVGTMGRVQYGLEYSHTTKTIWSGVGLTPNASENMVFTSMRYYLP